MLQSLAPPGSEKRLYSAAVESWRAGRHGGDGSCGVAFSTGAPSAVGERHLTGGAEVLWQQPRLAVAAGKHK